MTKKLVKCYLTELGLYSFFDGATIERVIENLIELKQSKPDSELILDVQRSSYSDDIEINVHETRLETDKEYRNRLASEEKEKQTKAEAKVKAEEKDRQEYERLKKKFEGA